MDCVAAATRVCQADPRAVRYAQAHAFLLRELLTGCGLGDALVRTVRTTGGEPAQMIGEALSAVRMTVREAAVQLGQSCPLASSFPAAVQAAVRHEASFADAILETARAGGDSAGRAAMVGAWLGAMHGVQAIPDEWRRLLEHHDRVERAVERMMSGVA
jgi:ADP-ribosylglycohydrolase